MTSEAESGPADEAWIEDLVIRARAGDRDAFSSLFEAHRKRLGAVVFLRLGALAARRVEVADVLQETAARALLSIPYFEWKGESSFLAWLRTISEHVILETVRKSVRGAVQPLEADSPASETGVVHRLERVERLGRLREALLSLRPDQRKVIVLAKLEGASLQSIAVAMGRSPDAVSSLLARSLLNLREAFGDTESLGLPDLPLEL